MDAISRLCRPEIYAMKPYSSARTEGSQDASVFLDANENPYPPFPGTDEMLGLNRYPDPQPASLLARFGELYDVPVTQLFLSRGADEAIDLLVRAFCEAGRDGILISPPTFVMYETAAEIQGANVFRVPLTDETYELDVDGLLSAQSANPEIKLVFVCSPNNPTSNLMDREAILRLADELLGKALVVVDQLYVEYSGEQPLSRDVAQHPNLVTLRSLSKEYSLAGERCGITIANPEVIGILTRIMAPYSLTVSSIRTIERAISPQGIAYGKTNMTRLLDERSRVESALSRSPIVRKVFPSDANFLLVQVVDPDGLTKSMEDHGIKIRNRNAVIEGTVRISIGTPQENDQLLKVIDEYADAAS